MPIQIPIQQIPPVPVISPPDVRLVACLGEGNTPLLPPAAAVAELPAGTRTESSDADDTAYPDYTVMDAEPELSSIGIAMRALHEMESAARVSEYHDFTWWRTRIEEIRAALSLQ